LYVTHFILKKINSKKMILVLCGNIGCGKSTACEYLVQSLGFQEMSFAEPLKKLAVSLGFNEKDVYGTQEEKAQINPYWGISGRQFMQRFGTDITRKNSHLLGEGISNVWIKAVECKIAKAKNNLVISDGRFEDEIEAVRKYGGIVIKLTRKTPYECTHESEQNFDKIKADYEYNNVGSKEDLYEFLKGLN